MASGYVQPLPAGTLGFDTNQPVDLEGARAFYEHGFRFACRYIPRRETHAHDLSAAELDHLFDAGLALMPVQHVENERSWIPSKEKGRDYGRMAAVVCMQLGLPAGVSVWLDLEGVDVHVPHATVIDYCQAWHLAVTQAGFAPGLYVGWHSGLTPDELYYRLAFTRYWAAYNLNADQYPATRGVCLKQHEAERGQSPVGFAIDTDVVRADALGGLPVAYAPDGWVSA